METFAAYAIIVPFYAVIVNDLGVNICLYCLFSVYIIVLSALRPDAWAFAHCKGCPADTLFACPKRGAPFACGATSVGRLLACSPVFCGKASTGIKAKTLTKPLCPALCGAKEQLRGIKTVRGKSAPARLAAKRTTTAKPLCLVRPANTQPSKRSCARFSERPRLRSSKCGKGFCKSKQVNVNLSLRNVIGCKR